MDITKEWVASQFPKREADSHKGTYGRLLTVTGRYGMAGASILCNRAALRCGVGLVTAAVPKSVYPIVAGQVPEAVFLPLPERETGVLDITNTQALCQAVSQADAVVMGCGMGNTAETAELVRQIRRACRGPLVLDADGINSISLNMMIAETASTPVIMTPHPGEMARLFHCSAEEIQQHRETYVTRLAEETGVIAVLKGHRTLIAARETPLLRNHTGNSGMATGGSGDVLAGIIGSLAAQGMSPLSAAACGVYLHGAAGDAAADRLSQHAMLPSDLIDELGGLFLNIEK